MLITRSFRSSQTGTGKLLRSSIDTLPDLHNGRTDLPASPELLAGGIVYCWRRTTEGAWQACAEAGNNELGLGRCFRDQCNKHVLQTEAPPSRKGINEWKGIFPSPR